MSRSDSDIPAIPEDAHHILFYSSPQGDIHVEVSFYDDNLWLTQKRLAELFGVDRSGVSRHLKNIFETGELEENSVCAFFAHTAEDGKTYRSLFYNLDAVIAFGYRVNSYKATQFRVWATRILREYLIKGFAMDDARLKQGQGWGKDYFEELLERIRDIRALSAGSTRRSRISTSNAPSTTTRRVQSLKPSLRQCRTSSTGLSTATQLPNWSV